MLSEGSIPSPMIATSQHFGWRDACSIVRFGVARAH